MQPLRSVFLLLGICVLTAAVALGAISLGSAASEQMAAKRRITEQFRQDLQDCENHDADAAHLCGHHAHAWAEVARAELATRRQRTASAPSEQGHVAWHYKTMLARCSAAFGWVRERCTGTTPSRAG